MNITNEISLSLEYRYTLSSKLQSEISSCQKTLHGKKCNTIIIPNQNNPSRKGVNILYTGQSAIEKKIKEKIAPNVVARTKFGCFLSKSDTSASDPEAPPSFTFGNDKAILPKPNSTKANSIPPIPKAHLMTSSLDKQTLIKSEANKAIMEETTQMSAWILLLHHSARSFRNFLFSLRLA
jgi:hypothetical protein